ncbi:MAG: hypothetical protein E7532_01590 [Ruminococcaceae bacterium]|nr:hypothetical protein [Oscillospiraceae bacterium]
MKKILYKTTSLILAILIICSLAIYVSAEDVMEPLVHTPCSGGNGICQMVSHCYAHLYNKYTGEPIYTYMKCWQCKNCLTVMATEGEAAAGLPIGHYVTVSYQWELDTSIHNYFYIDPARINYTSSSKLEGYRFMYQS